MERLLDWIYEILDKAKTPLAIGDLKTQVTNQFQASLSKIEVLMSLDKRFSCNSEGNWQLAHGKQIESNLSVLIQQALDLREQAVDALQKEQIIIQERISSAQERLQSIYKQLIRLGYQPDMDLQFSKPTSDGEYTLEYHLNRTSLQTRDLALQFHQAILTLPGTHAVFNKYHIAYTTQRRFTILIPRQSKLVIHVHSGQEFGDPGGWLRNATSRRLGFDSIFELTTNSDFGYAMKLVEQSYHLVNRGKA
jgi:hypothetical protein